MGSAPAIRILNGLPLTQNPTTDGVIQKFLGLISLLEHNSIMGSNERGWTWRAPVVFVTQMRQSDQSLQAVPMPTAWLFSWFDFNSEFRYGWRLGGENNTHARRMGL